MAQRREGLPLWARCGSNPLLLLQRLCAAGRASPLSTPSRQNVWVWGQSIEELEATSGCKVTPRKNYEDASGDEWRTAKALMAAKADIEAKDKVREGGGRAQHL